jgi:hypothetical protein
MTGKTINNGATVPLILLLPFALIIIVIFTAWPVLLTLIILTLIWKIWEDQDWKKWSEQVNPYFNLLIQDNQGCLTALDLSIKANITARAAERYLGKKAEEYGAQCKFYEDQGKVYYFLTASAFRGILQDSEPFIDIDGEISEAIAVSQPERKETEVKQIVTPEQPIPETSTQDIARLVEIEDDVEDLSEEIEAFDENDDFDAMEEMEEDDEPPKQILTLKEALDFSDDMDPLEDEEDQQAIAAPDQPNTIYLSQEDLAKRLNLQPSTVGKRKYNRNFPKWTQTKDPERKAWVYDRQKKLFRPMKP